MEVPLMPSYVGGSHPLKMMVGMAHSPPRDPSPPQRTDSRGSSRGSPAQQPPTSRTGFSIADILKPEFGSKGDDHDKEDSEEEVEVDRRNKHEEKAAEHSVFKAEPLKDRLKLPGIDQFGDQFPKGKSPKRYHQKLPMETDFKINGLMAPKPLHGLPRDISPAYYQSYYSLCQQKYADYMQFYGQSRMLPFQLPQLPAPTGQPLKNPLQLAHEQLLAKHQLPQPQQPVQGRVPFPSSAPSLYPPHIVHPAQASAYLPQGPYKLDHHDAHRQRSPLSHFSQPGRDLEIGSPNSIASSPSPVPRQRAPSDTQRQITERTRSPSTKTSGSRPPSSRSPLLTSPGAGGERGVQVPDSTSRDSSDQGSPQGDNKDDSMWPAWVYCTRYSDRPSSGPRSRKMRRNKDKNSDEKRPRTAFTNDQLDFLRREFESNKYLTEERRQRLAKELNLTESQIKIWFQNKRAKLKKSSGGKNALAISLMAQGLYKHTADNEDSNCSTSVQEVDIAD